MAIVLRDATPDDDEAIRQVQKQTWLATYPNAALGITSADIIAMFDDASEEAQQRRAARRRSINATPQAHLWVAEGDSGIIGFCLARKIDDTHRIQALYVLPAYQGQGIGKRLMHAALDWLGAALPVKLTVASYNQRAIAFYQQCGFVVTGPPDHAEVVRLPSGAVIPELEMVKSNTAPEG